MLNKLCIWFIQLWNVTKYINSSPFHFILENFFFTFNTLHLFENFSY